MNADTTELLPGKTILVTGAAKRIGRGIALRLARRRRARRHPLQPLRGGSAAHRRRVRRRRAVPRQPGKRAGDRAHVRRRGAAPRTARRPGQQCRALHALRSARDHREGLGLHPLRQPEGRLLLLPAGGAPHAAAGRRAASSTSVRWAASGRGRSMRTTARPRPA